MRRTMRVGKICIRHFIVMLRFAARANIVRRVHDGGDLTMFALFRDYFFVFSVLIIAFVYRPMAFAVGRVDVFAKNRTRCDAQSFNALWRRRHAPFLVCHAREHRSAIVIIWRGATVLAYDCVFRSCFAVCCARWRVKIGRIVTNVIRGGGGGGGGVRCIEVCFCFKTTATAARPIFVCSVLRPTASAHHTHVVGDVEHCRERRVPYGLVVAVLPVHVVVVLFRRLDVYVATLQSAAMYQNAIAMFVCEHVERQGQGGWR